MAYTPDQVVACYHVVGGGLHASLDDALAAADALNATAGTDEDGRGLAVVTPAMTIRYGSVEPDQDTPAT